MAPQIIDITDKRAADDGLTEVGQPKKRVRSTYAQPIKVLVGVGDSTNTFFVREDMICGKSSFFKAACSKDWRENQEKTVKLPDQEGAVFEMYLECVYTDEVDLAALSGMPATIDDKNGATTTGWKEDFAEVLMSLCKLWIAIDYLGDTKTQNEVMDSIVGIFAANSDAVMSLEIATFIARGTLPESGLHRWMVEVMASCLKRAQAEKLVESLPGITVAKILSRLLAFRINHGGEAVPQKQRRAKYHV